MAEWQLRIKEVNQNLNDPRIFVGVMTYIDQMCKHTA